MLVNRITISFAICFKFLFLNLKYEHFNISNLRFTLFHKFKKKCSKYANFGYHFSKKNILNQKYNNV